MSDLLPCPFCGNIPLRPGCYRGDAETLPKWGWVECGCGARAGDVRTGYEGPEEWGAEADAEWNTHYGEEAWQTARALAPEAFRAALAKYPHDVKGALIFFANAIGLGIVPPTEADIAWAKARVAEIENAEAARGGGLWWRGRRGLGGRRRSGSCDDLRL